MFIHIAFNCFWIAKAVAVVRTMVSATRNHIATHDWHVGNVGFPEENPEVMKLLDWEKTDRLWQPSPTLKGWMPP